MELPLFHSLGESAGPTPRGQSRGSVQTTAAPPSCGGASPPDVRPGGRGTSRPPLPALKACPLDTMVWSHSKSSPAGGAQSFLCPPHLLPSLPVRSRVKAAAKGPFKSQSLRKALETQVPSSQSDPDNLPMLSGNSQPLPELFPTLTVGLSPSVCVGVGSRMTEHSVFTPVLWFSGRLGKLVCKGSDSKYFRLSVWGPFSLRHIVLCCYFNNPLET